MATYDSSFPNVVYMSTFVIGERACTVDDLRNEVEAHKRQLAETSAQAVSGLVSRKLVSVAVGSSTATWRGPP